MNPISALSLYLGTAWASGINLYASVFMLGWLGQNGVVKLPPALEVTTHPLVMTVAGLMFVVEFFADKIPGLDSVWDAVHTFIRIPAGAVLASASLGSLDPAAHLAAGMVAGTITATSHFTKAGTRALINTSPEPVSNWTASLAEDAMVIVEVPPANRRD